MKKSKKLDVPALDFTLKNRFPFAPAGSDKWQFLSHHSVLGNLATASPDIFTHHTLTQGQGPSQALTQPLKLDVMVGGLMYLKIPILRVISLLVTIGVLIAITNCADPNSIAPSDLQQNQMDSTSQQQPSPYPSPMPYYPPSPTVSPSSGVFAVPGTQTFVVPAYSSLTVTVNGAGGSSSSSTGSVGATGGISSFGSITPLIGYGGGGGGGGSGNGAATWLNQGIAGLSGQIRSGAPGIATGGLTNVTGAGAAGGAAAGGYSLAGGAGGQAQITWSAGSSGAPNPGDTITVVIGAGGTTSGGTSGTPGSVDISWQ